MRTASASFPGAYPLNEDAVGRAVAGRFVLYALADGLGGHALGEVAARLAVERVTARFREAPSIDDDALEELALDAHRALGAEAEAREQPDGVRCTIVLLGLDGGTARWAHVGDSRLYHFREGRMISRTLDHSVPEMLHRTGDIDEEEIRGHPDRARLLQVLGQEGEPRVSVSDRVRLKTGDAFLLCSDGWWEPVDERQMADDLAAVEDPGEWLERMGARIEAAGRSSQDNYSATAVFLT